MYASTEDNSEKIVLTSKEFLILRLTYFTGTIANTQK